MVSKSLKTCLSQPIHECFPNTCSSNFTNETVILNPCTYGTNRWRIGTETRTRILCSRCCSHTRSFNTLLSSFACFFAIFFLEPLLDLGVHGESIDSRRIVSLEQGVWGFCWNCSWAICINVSRGMFLIFSNISIPKEANNDSVLVTFSYQNKTLKFSVFIKTFFVQ